MLVAIPIAGFLVLFWCLCRAGVRPRERLVWTALGWASWLTLLTEVLGVAHALTALAVTAGWMVFVLACGWIALRIVPGNRAEAEPRAPIGSLEKAMLAGIVVLSGVVLLTALLSAPNTWDAMDYHMPRVAMWASNRSVSFFPTVYMQQLFLAPWAEYAMLHLYITAGGDRFVSLVQWFSMAGCGMVASLIARELGAPRRGQVLAALVSLTIPQGILEASGAMNGYVVSFWLAAMFYFVLRARRDCSWPNLLGIAGTLALAVLSKGTAYVLAPPLLAAGVWMCEPQRRRRLVLGIAAAGLVTLALNSPLYVRNIRLSGSPLGLSAPDGNPRHTFANARLTPRSAASNVLRNLSLHLGTPIPRINDMTERLTTWAIRWTGSSPDDPDTTWAPFHVNPMSRLEVTAGNALHLFLLLGVCLYLLAFRTRYRDSAITAMGLACAFFLYCALLRWQLWNGRFHLPLFVIGSALVGVALAERPRAAAAIAAFLFVAALPFALGNALRPLLSGYGTVFTTARTTQYFTDMHGAQEGSYIAAAADLQRQGCRSIGLDSSLYRFEYPMLALLGAGVRTSVHYTGVLNDTREYRQPGDAADCAVVCLNCAGSRSKWSLYRTFGGRVSVFDHVAVFSAKGKLVNPEGPLAPWPRPREEAGRVANIIEQSMSAILHTDLGPVERAVDRAVRTQPAERKNLMDALESLYALRLHAAHTYDAAEVLLRRGRFDEGDRSYLMAAAETLVNAQAELTGKAREIIEETEGRRTASQR